MKTLQDRHIFDRQPFHFYARENKLCHPQITSELYFLLIIKIHLRYPSFFSLLLFFLSLYFSSPFSLLDKLASNQLASFENCLFQFSFSQKQGTNIVKWAFPTVFQDGSEDITAVIMTIIILRQLCDETTPLSTFTLK